MGTYNRSLVRSSRAIAMKEKIYQYDRRTVIDILVCEAKRKKEREERKEKQALEWEKVRPIMESFRESFAGVLDKQEIDRIISSFTSPPARYSAIVRIGRALADAGVPCEEWVKNATKRYLEE